MKNKAKLFFLMVIGFVGMGYGAIGHTEQKIELPTPTKPTPGGFLITSRNEHLLKSFYMEDTTSFSSNAQSLFKKGRYDGQIFHSLIDFTLEDGLFKIGCYESARYIFVIEVYVSECKKTNDDRCSCRCTFRSLQMDKMNANRNETFKWHSFNKYKLPEIEEEVLAEIYWMEESFYNQHKNMQQKSSPVFLRKVDDDGVFVFEQDEFQKSVNSTLPTMPKSSPTFSTTSKKSLGAESTSQLSSSASSVSSGSNVDGSPRSSLSALKFPKNATISFQNFLNTSGPAQ